MEQPSTVYVVSLTVLLPGESDRNAPASLQARRLNLTSPIPTPGFHGQLDHFKVDTELDRAVVATMGFLDAQE